MHSFTSESRLSNTQKTSTSPSLSLQIKVYLCKFQLLSSVLLQLEVYLCYVHKMWEIDHPVLSSFNCYSCSRRRRPFLWFFAFRSRAYPWKLVVFRQSSAQLPSSSASFSFAIRFAGVNFCIRVRWIKLVSRGSLKY